MQVSVLIVAAGRGTRAGGAVPKQYQSLRGEPVLRHTMRACLAHPNVRELCVVIHKDDGPNYTACISPLDDPRIAPSVIGGATRSQSVANGLRHIKGDTVLIHDGARPLLDLASMSRLIEELKTHQAAFLGLPITDAVWNVSENLAQSEQPRDGLWRAQTPQGFRTADILQAHQNAPKAANDDVGTAFLMGIKSKPVLGSEANLKITHADDFARAEKLLESTMDVRTGNGFDVHKIGPGDHVVLNGLKIPHTGGLIGHSDADVGMHAITDAIFGALAEGDIGQWFPPSDQQWKGSSSDIFLRKAMERAQERGFVVANLDCTLICEMPKIGPHALAMRQNLSRITGIAIDRISVKATTSETLGFTGRGEGIAAMATATLVTA